jgi:excisionase family DNA binding protein
VTEALLSVREAAVRLAVSEDTVRRMARGGKLSRVRVGERLVRYRESEVQALIGAGRRVDTRDG